ncbi:hypothetical protein E4U15_005886 [Claviceps sp. LM218 group G6]|nr:hypothetical protein E4U15_005886 [Claviceps sp. LM218 group G6]
MYLLVLSCLAWIWRIWLPRHHRRPLLDCRCCLPNFIPPTINSLSCPLHARPPPNNPRSHRQRSKSVFPHSVLMARWPGLCSLVRRQNTQFNTQFNTQARQLASRFIIPR